jgi:exopolysaccharide biosynthesis predicted pyruvyltransferase EpsI
MWLKCLGEIQQRIVNVLGDIFDDVSPSSDVLLVDPAYHTNAGDNFLVLGESLLLHHYPLFGSRLLACGSHQSFLYGPQWAQHSVIPHCGDFSRYDASQIPVAMWHGGGNWGSLYPINARR